MSDSEEPTQGKELFRTPSKEKTDLTASLKPPSSVREGGGSGGSKESGGSGGSKDSGSSGGGMSGSSGSGMSNPPVVPGPPADRDDADPEDAVGMRKALRQMGIRPPRAFDPKKTVILRAG